MFYQPTPCWLPQNNAHFNGHPRLKRSRNIRGFDVFFVIRAQNSVIAILNKRTAGGLFAEPSNHDIEVL